MLASKRVSGTLHSRHLREGSDKDYTKMLALSDSDNDSQNEKLEDIRKTFKMPDFTLSDEDDEILDLYEKPIVSHLPNLPESKIPMKPQKTKIAILGSVTGNQDLKKIMATIIHDNKTKDLAIKSLKTELSDSQQIMDEAFADGGNESDMRNGRIKELSRKSRRLTVAYEKERNKSAILQTKLSALEARMIASAAEGPNITDEKVLKLKSEMKPNKERLAHALRKIEDERIHSQLLKVEVRNLNRVLLQELGEGYNLEKLLKGDSSFKGRAEQISILKEKVKDLNRKLANSTRNSGESISSRKPLSADSKDLNGIYKQELSKRKELEKVVMELDAVKKEMVEIRKKNDGLSSRAKILEGSNREAKAKIGFLLKKGSNDDELIAVLQQEAKKTDDNTSGNRKAHTAVEKLRQVVESQDIEMTTLKKKIHSFSAAENQISMESSVVNDREGQRMALLVTSFKHELKSLRSKKSALESQLMEEIKKSSQLHEEYPVIKTVATKKSELILELKESIAILTDENDSLKLLLDTSNGAKASDLALYQSLLDQARHTFENAIL